MDDAGYDLSVTTGWQGLLEHGQRRRIHRGRRTVYGTTCWTEQREAAAELSVPRDLSKDYWPTGSSGRRRRLRRGRSTFRGTTGRTLYYISARWLFWSTPRQADESTTRPSGSGPTRQSDARDFEPSFYTPIDEQGSGRVANEI